MVRHLSLFSLAFIFSMLISLSTRGEKLQCTIYLASPGNINIPESTLASAHIATSPESSSPATTFLNLVDYLVAEVKRVDGKVLSVSEKDRVVLKIWNSLKNSHAPKVPDDFQKLLPFSPALSLAVHGEYLLALAKKIDFKGWRLVREGAGARVAQIEIRRETQMAVQIQTLFTIDDYRDMNGDVTIQRLIRKYDFSAAEKILSRQIVSRQHLNSFNNQGLTTLDLLWHLCWSNGPDRQECGSEWRNLAALLENHGARGSNDMDRLWDFYLFLANQAERVGYLVLLRNIQNMTPEDIFGSRIYRLNLVFRDAFDIAKIKTVHDLIQIFLNLGLSPGGLFGQTKPLLHIAVEKRNLEFAQAILELSTAKNLFDSDLPKAAQLAKDRSDSQMLNLLERYLKGLP